jgi:hypothetical protein
MKCESFWTGTATEGRQEFITLYPSSDLEQFLAQLHGTDAESKIESKFDLSSINQPQDFGKVFH